MSVSATDFERTAIRPMDCLSESWNLMAGKYWLFLAICLVGLVIQGLVPFKLLTGPMFCGIYVAWFAISDGRTLRFEMLFKGFDVFVPSLLASLILTAITLVVTLPCMGLLFAGMAAGAAAGQDNPEVARWLILLAVAVFTLVLLTLMTILWTFFIWVYPLIVDRKLNAIEALTTSARAAGANIWGVLGLIGVISIVVTVAFFLCVIPMILVAPWCFGAVGVAYRRVFPRIPEASPAP